MAMAGKKNVKIFMEGAFDLMHYGHMNAFRLGKSLGTHLVVGVNDGESIAECKGSQPVMSDQERCDAVRGCRFVDDVIERTPYVMTPEYLEKVCKEYDIDFAVHGDDPCLDVNGQDVYGHVKSVGKYKSIPRTEGVSTTDIVGRMLLCNKAHHQGPNIITKAENERGQFASKFMTSAQVLRGFSAGMEPPPRGAKVVYMDGAWDMFHAGHVKMLEQASKLGDYLLVGVFSDATVNRYRGANFPIMNMQERALSVMGCKYVNDVILDAPFVIDEDIIKSQSISIVVHGSVQDDDSGDSLAYEVPRKMGIFKSLTSSSTLTTGDIIDRIQTNKERYEKKFADKLKKEQAYYAERYGRTEKGEKEA